MADPVERSYTLYRGAKFGPVTWSFGPAVTGETVDISDASVRIQTSSGYRDSTVGNGEIAVDNVAKTVALTMLEAETPDLSAGTWRGQVTVIDAAGEDQIPVVLLLDIRTGIS